MEVLVYMFIQELDFQNIVITEHVDYKGYKISFLLNNQRYLLLVGKTKILFPLSIIHVFNEKERCQFCNKLVFKSSISQQVCLPLLGIKKELLAYFQKYHSELLT